MPIEVDVDARLDALARATIAVAGREGGANGVTMRRVATELGGSTTMVTNYVPSRAALLVNAIAYMLRRWERDLAAALAGVPDGQRLLAFARWSCTTDLEDMVFRQLLVELVARHDQPPELRALVQDARDHHEDFAAAARADGLAPGAAEAAADVLFLLIRGFYYESVEDPERWDSDRVLPLVERVVDLLRAR
jgi:AcrR family transcriptional regulator